MVKDALAAYKKQCKDDVAQANRDLDKKIQTRKGRKEIEEMFKFVLSQLKFSMSSYTPVHI